MKLSKGQGLSLFATLALFGVFSAVVFVAPLAHTVVFWLGYMFALFALLAVTMAMVLFFGKPVKEDKFLSLPAVRAAWIYFILQMVLSAWEMIASPFSYQLALIINLALGALCIILVAALCAASGRIDRAAQFTAEKVIFIKELKLKLNSIETDDEALSKKINELAEAVRYSDPMSHSKLAEIEFELDGVVDELADSASDTERATALCDKATGLLKKRNQQCKIYKGQKDHVAAAAKKSPDGGSKMALAGVCVLLGILLVTLCVCFLLVPQVKYDDAVSLMKAGKYDKATAAFEELGNYGDSRGKIEEIQNLLLDEDYNAAMALLQAGKYEEASAAFAKLGDYRDSKSKVEEISNMGQDERYNEAMSLFNAGQYEAAMTAFEALGDYRDSQDKAEESRTALFNAQYEEAERLFNAGNYSKALNLYSAMGDYKESKLRVEQIYNRLSDGDVLYFGSYNGEPVEWKILKTETDKMLLLTEEPIAQKPFTDDIKKVTWETSSLRAWLNNEFIKSFSTDQQKQIVSTDTGDTQDKVFLLSVDEIVTLSKTVEFSTEEEWWTRSATENGIKYMTGSGWVISQGDLAVRDKGVRPAIWISLK